MALGETCSIHALELGPMENFVYLIHDHASGRAAVVDPAWDVPEVLALAKRLGVTITDILLTHSHHDHTNGIEAVLQQYDAQLHLLKAEAQFWGNCLDLPTLHHGGDVIELGETWIRHYGNHQKFRPSDVEHELGSGTHEKGGPESCRRRSALA